MVRQRTAWLGRLTLALVLVFLILAVGLAVGFIISTGQISALQKRGTNIGDVLGPCEVGQVIQWNGTDFLCTGDVMRLRDLNDTNVLQPKPEDQQCLCFNRPLWIPQGPFVGPDDVPDFLNGTILPCENLPDDLCQALRWGTLVGTWDADANDPLLASGGCPFGDFYVVAVAGNTDLDGSAVWDVGDSLACSTVGWNRIGKDFPVLAVNEMVGDVLLGLGDLTDVDLAGQANGDFLQRVGGIWTPRQLLLVLDNLTDVNAAGASAGDAIKFDGANWELDPLCCLALGDVAQREGMRVRKTIPQIVFSNPAGFQTVLFNNVLDDPGGNYNPVNGRYQAPEDGFYGAWTSLQWGANGIVDVAQQVTRGQLLLNGATVLVRVKEHLRDSNTGPPVTGTQGNTQIALGFFRMDAGDTLEVQIGQTNLGGVASGAVGIFHSSTFSVVLWGLV